MRGREFLGPAGTLARRSSEADWRGAAVHAYYALFLECRDALRRWGRLPAGRQNIHAVVRLKFTYAPNPELKSIEKALDSLSRLRNDASYDLSLQPQFTSSSTSQDAINTARDTIALLDAIETDPQRRSAAIASLPP
jgi:HEPN domain-containing protein